MRQQPVGTAAENKVAEVASVSEAVAQDIVSEGQPETTLGYCGVCRDWYEVVTGTGDRCPLCGYRAGDL